MTEQALGQLVATRTMNVAVNHSRFGNEKQASLEHVTIDKTAAGAETSKSMVRLMKDLLASPELDAIEQFDSETCAILRWKGHSSRLRPGMYVISTGLVRDINQLLKDRAVIRAELVSRAVEMYPQRCLEAAQSLGVVYNPADYIPVEAFAARFHFTYRWAKVIVPPQLQDIDLDAFEQEQAKDAAINQRLGEEIRQAARETVAELVAHFREVLEPTADGKRKRFYDSNVTTLQEFLDMFRFRNETEDGELASIVEQARALVAGMDPEEFRDKSPAGDARRREVRDELAKLEAVLEPLAKPEKTRRIRVSAAA